jgi:hypothetical protein
MKIIRVPHLFVTSCPLYYTYIINGTVSNTEKGHLGSNATNFLPTGSPFYSGEKTEYLGWGFCGFSQLQ